MLGFIGRLDYQKGVDLINDNYDWLMSGAPGPHAGRGPGDGRPLPRRSSQRLLSAVVRGWVAWLTPPCGCWPRRAPLRSGLHARVSVSEPCAAGCLPQRSALTAAPPLLAAPCCVRPACRGCAAGHAGQWPRGLGDHPAVGREGRGGGGQPDGQLSAGALAPGLVSSAPAGSYCRVLAVALAQLCRSADAPCSEAMGGTAAADLGSRRCHGLP